MDPRDLFSLLFSFLKNFIYFLFFLEINVLISGVMAQTFFVSQLSKFCMEFTRTLLLPSRPLPHISFPGKSQEKSPFSFNCQVCSCGHASAPTWYSHNLGAASPFPS